MQPGRAEVSQSNLQNEARHFLACLGRRDLSRVERGTARGDSSPLRPDAWGRRIIAGLPADLRKHAHDEWVATANSGPRCVGLRHEGQPPYAQANRALWQLRDELRALRFDHTADAHQIERAALVLASLSERRKFSGEALAAHFGIELGWPKSATQEGIQRRFEDPRWWRRQLHKVIGRSVEETMRRRGLVRRGRAAYVTDWSMRRWAGRRAANHRMIEDSVLLSDCGEQLELSEVVAASVSNPANRRREMMLRARGFEELAVAAGHTWVFITATAPSAFHPQLSAGGANGSYRGATVRDAQAWLQERWQCVRAKLQRLGIQVYGFRVAEPHHDGTPHWHMLLFVDQLKRQALQDAISDEWLSEYAGEPGAARYRVTFVLPDGRRGGSAAGYIAKYIGKGIDGTACDEDFEAGIDGADGAARATAWASIHGVRQFQQIGGPTVGLWREIRRLREPSPVPEVEAARVHVDKPASWSRFVDAVGGIAAGRRTTLQVWSQVPLQLGRYGEQRAAVPVGVKSESHRVRTRSKVWRIMRRDCVAGARAACAALSSLGPVSITVRSQTVQGGRGIDGESWRATAWAH